MKFNTIRFKIGVFYTSILGIILIIYTSVLHTTLCYNLYVDFDNKLEMKTQGIINTVVSYLDALGYNQRSFIFSAKRAIGIEEEHPNQNRIEKLQSLWLKQFNTFGLVNDYINFANSKGESIVSSSNLKPELLSLFLREIKRARDEEKVFRNIKFNNRTLRLISVPFSYKDKAQYIIQVGVSLEPVISLMKKRLYFRLIPIPVFLLVGFFIGRIFARQILKPVMEVTRTAKSITHEDLSLRVKVEHIDDEMRYLVDAFNDMISRLEKSFKYIAEFNSNVAHELKTPLTIMRGQSEVALRKERAPEEYKKVIEVNLEEAERMLKMAEDLLLLTKMDYRTEVFKFEQFDLTQFLKEIYEQSKILASEKDIAVTIDMPQEPETINADKLHLRRLFFNLIDNAIKFTPQNGRIDIRAEYADKKATVSISDTGAGIAEKDLTNIFNKFFHTAQGIQSSTSGSGLGLSIAQSIAKLHKGNIMVESQLGKGSTFTVTLPLL